MVNTTMDMSTREALRSLQTQMTVQRSVRDDGEIWYELGAASSGKNDENVKAVVKLYPSGGKCQVQVHFREYFFDKKEKIDKPKKAGVTLNLEIWNYFFSQIKPKKNVPKPGTTKLSFSQINPIPPPIEVIACKTPKGKKKSEAVRQSLPAPITII